MRPYRDPTTGEYVAEHETREADGTVRRTTEWFESESAARAYARNGGTVMELTGAQRRVLACLNDTPHTPAELKTVLPGRVPVATIRDLLGQLREMGYAATAVHAKHPGVTAWVRVAS